MTMMKAKERHYMNVFNRLEKVMKIVKSRGDERDLPGGERSMERAVRIYNSITDSTMRTSDGWRFMMCLKLSRMMAGTYKEDDYDDLIGYAALLAEEATAEHGEPD